MRFKFPAPLCKVFIVDQPQMTVRWVANSQTMFKALSNFSLDLLKTLSSKMNSESNQSCEQKGSPRRQCVGVSSEGVLDGGGQQYADDEAGDGAQDVGRPPPVALDVRL
jgi:hypothetical protein